MNKTELLDRWARSGEERTLLARVLDKLELARERDIVVMRSELRMFIACGLLYSRGLAGE